MVNLDSKYPILFLPIRIETKYSNQDVDTRRLRVRFFPDDISIDSFDLRLTSEEIKDARTYWKKVKKIDPSSTTFETERDNAWRELAHEHGCTRAAYISKAVIVYDPVNDPDPTDPMLRDDSDIEIRNDNEHKAAVTRALPEKFVIFGKFKDNTLGTIRANGKTIPKILDISPFSDKPEMPTATSPITRTKAVESYFENIKWLVDFEAAKDVGMALEIPLDENQYSSGFEYLIAYGIRDVPPDEAQKEIYDLFASHHYTDKFSFLKSGTPTNLVSEQPGEYSTSEPNSIDCRSREFSRLMPNISRSPLIGWMPDGGILIPDGRIFDIAIGAGPLSDNIKNADSLDQMDYTQMSVALWPTLLGYFLERFVNYDKLNPTNLRKYFIKYVKGNGCIPSFRIGKVPYGILPLTSIQDWKDTSIIPNTDDVRNFFLHLKMRWTEFVDNVPTIMKAGSVNAEKTLMDVLSMEPSSHSYYVRGVRSLDYIRRYLSSGFRIHMSDSDYNWFSEYYKESVNRILSTTLPITSSTIKNIEAFYSMVLGAGIVNAHLPLVKFSQDDNLVDPNYVELMYKDISSGTKDFLKPTSHQPPLTNYKADPLLFKLLRYSASFSGRSSNQNTIEELTNSLEHLLGINPQKLERLMLQTLDLVSYRLDAWLTSFANQRLEYLRENNPRGLYLGMYGWIENLKPKKQGQITKDVPRGGYIHAPSNAHATAAAVLRNGYLTHFNDSDKKDLLKINLNSDRTKRSLEIIQGIQNIPITELLGYRLERRLHDSEIDYLIDEFRMYFPLKKDDLKELNDVPNQPHERVVPRNLTDGLLLYKNWKRLIEAIGGSSSNTAAIENFMKNDPTWSPFYNTIGPNSIDSIKPHLDYLLEIMDGVSDLCIAEAVYQAVNGNYERAASVLDGISGDAKIPIPEISNTPRSGIHQSQRIMLALEVDPIRSLELKNVGSVSWTNPRKVAEPNLNKLLESYYGDVTFWIDFIDDGGNITSTDTIKLSNVGLEAIDLLYIQETELEDRLAYYAKTKGKNNFKIHFKKRLSSDTNTKSFQEMRILIKSLQNMVVDGQTLSYFHFTPSQQATTNHDDILQKELLKGMTKELFQRFYNLLALIIQIIKELEAAKTDDTSKDSLQNKKDALMKASLFGIPSAIPLENDGSLLDSVLKLNEKIELTLKDLKFESDKFGDYENKLTEWKAKFENEGEHSLLESIYEKLEDFKSEINSVLKTKLFLLLIPFKYPTEFLSKFKNTPVTDRKALKWLQKASYVRPRLKYFDNVIMFAKVLDKGHFSFYYDESKFNQNHDVLSNFRDGADNMSSLIILPTNRVVNVPPTFPSVTEKKLTGIVVDEWVDKIVSAEEDSFISLHYDSPNAEAPHSLILAVSPNDEYSLDPDANPKAISNLILDAFELMKIRAVDYRSLKDLRQFLPTTILNSFGDEVYIRFYEREI